METGINWLKLIYEAIKNLGNSIAGANQSDWNEADSTSAAYIKNKPTVPTVTIVEGTVEGTVSDGVFTESEGQPSPEDAIALIQAGGLVYLSFSDSQENDYLLLVTTADATSTCLSTPGENITWEAAESEEAAES